MTDNPSLPAPSPELRSLAAAVHEKLLQVYGLPVWREPLPAIDELVCTILSQNTNDKNRDIAFDALRARFPTWEAVRDAPQDQVVDAVRIAGLANQKGPRIQSVLRQITAERGEISLEFLKDYPAQEALDWLLRFKGVGPKTASIVLVFSLGLPAFPVDTHIHRVSRRLGLRPEGMSADQAHQHLASLFNPEDFGPDHMNLIRLGREICHARKPQCDQCPLRALCPYPDRP